MRSSVLVVLFSFICPALMAVVGLGAAAMYPEMDLATGALVKLGIFICSALLIVGIFVRQEKGPVSLGELWSVEVLCLLWTLALDYGLLQSIVSQDWETVGFHGVAGALGLAVALNLFMIHIPFGVVGRRFAELRLRSLEVGAQTEDA